ncbi:MAG: SDR family oxidoreductase [Ewingella americana]|uniref:SDR family NAD(P)-dependent oxidoreductase n=1 Tax=Ewingella americana TaxID=41202 RepID=UPI00242ED826|nr:SDR family oxidoreductase [Ewingella americana]MCI1678289.1 SDR family oxidoreductase [Ewingella americana]MCI1856074.1 SDR family oxidoreductase [Ewingella americana]MCI1862299.1 SDR family oxidoreductase [Ewingella americana]MCI2142748.1 SDR family oxidoreductase [Ewingella americana]MCI2162539.1 SDR family oxidoreductase [Ewingella americana]
MFMKLSGKVAIVTGGNSGIGLASAKALIAEGVHVYITGRRAEELQAAATILGSNVTTVQGDVSNPDDVEALYQLVKKQHSRVDIVFANAGVVNPAPLGSLTDEHIDNMLNINVKGVIWTVQKALPLMGSGGSIILSSSIVASKGFPSWSIYSASKAAVRSFARTWASDLQGKNIRVNAISPGVIDTPGHSRPDTEKAQVEAFFSHVASLTPLQRVGSDDEVAKTVCFLASEESSFINGVELFIDGGFAQI